MPLTVHAFEGGQRNVSVTFVRYVDARLFSRVLEKLVQRVRSCEDRQSRNRHNDGEKQRFDYKFPTLFAREIAPA